MKKSVLISLIALGISLVGLLIALAAWLHKKREMECDDFDNDLLTDEDDSEYIAAQYAEHADDHLDSDEEDTGSSDLEDHSEEK